MMDGPRWCELEARARNNNEGNEMKKKKQSTQIMDERGQGGSNSNERNLSSG